MPNTTQFFDILFNNARTNAMMIMSMDGIVESVNEAFTLSFGYTTDDLRDKHFRVLYIEKDQATRRPEIELNQTHRTGSSSDENYLVHKDTTPIWVTGESILVKTDDTSCIVKLIHNIHAQKQLERYLLSSSELLGSLFESVQQSGLLLLNSQMKLVRTNGAFRKMFGVRSDVAEGSKLQDIGNSFWTKEELRQEIRNVIVTGVPMKKEFVYDKGDNDCVRYEIISKQITGDGDAEHQLLLMIKEV
ncbi:PAS domain S-box-containing protein [Cnuella takakiae]|uniref:PAS domain S-box-containing protein n=1 Tax=Cnuella takakiae TaxID=1302690 RepID=A0A1M4WQ55_9BACT|nr:PAS domain-containing protein [Cnuella takakiae]OLY91650.1 hypothetical protein BUE76_06890 [Cnuella takakiae]SHE83369.1 PAS domain S-box-containing protein [Cnuella takakiae]